MEHPALITTGVHVGHARGTSSHVKNTPISSCRPSRDEAKWVCGVAGPRGHNLTYDVAGNCNVRFYVVADWTTYESMLDARKWCFQSERAAETFRPGSRAVVYLMARLGPFSGVAAVIESTGGPAPTSRRPGFATWYPFSVPVRVILRGTPAPVKPVLDSLSFVPKGRAWGLAFRGHAIRGISLPDFEILASLITEPTSKKIGGRPV